MSERAPGICLFLMCVFATVSAVRGAEQSDGHWAFQSPRRPPLPQVQDFGWVSNSIDTFVLARLEAEGLGPALRADRVTLLRRLSLDLLGLPPGVEEIDAFVADTRVDAYQRAVDRLLASPHYGERWGRQWLDAARYADSDGFEKDRPRTVWFYRDWVVNALNRDLPYDRFIVEQLAGDQLPHATQDQIVATGFLRNSMNNEEGGTDPEQFRMEALFDRVDAIGKSILGLTVQCSQCHDHKYDPLSQEEYYRMFAFLNNDHEANVAVYTPQELLRRAGILREIASVQSKLRHRNPDWRERMARWEDAVRDDQPEWHVVTPRIVEVSSGGQRFLPQDDGSLLAQGYSPVRNRPEFIVTTDTSPITAFRLEFLLDPNLPLGGPGRSVYGTAALTEFEVEVEADDGTGSRVKVVFSEATSDLELPETLLPALFDDRSERRRVIGPARFAIDGKQETAWGTDAGPGRRNRARQAVFTVESPIVRKGGTVLHVFFDQKHGGWNNNDNQNHNIGRFRLSVTGACGAVADPIPRRVRDIFAIPVAERSANHVAEVFSYWRTVVPGWRDANDRIESLWREHPSGTSQLVLQGRNRARPTRVLDRGDFLKPTRRVQAGVPAFLHPLAEDVAPTRLTFARWLVDRRSPTTSRSLVNRVWQSYFGTGIVASSEDFGTRAEAPSHPGLLDWLAVEFMDGGWSLKRLHGLIVNSSTYRQSSRVTPELLARDPGNRLLARGTRLRVEGEVVRDIALAASGLLTRRIGGRGVYPPLPEFLLRPPASFGTKTWVVETDGERYRRALYTFRFRSIPYPMLEVFDVPNGDFSCVRRPRSNTPLQALVTLNEPIFFECARALAERTRRECGEDDKARITFAFRSCLSRHPVAEEMAALLELLASQRDRRGESDITPWVAVARVLLNLDETITRE